MKSLPWSSPMRLGEVNGPLRRGLSPDEAARKRIARELDLVEITSLEADLEVEPWFDGVKVRGTWRAKVAQSCGVTLERLDSDLSGDFSLSAVPEGSIHAPSLEEQLAYDPEAPEPPDVLEGDTFDLAHYVVEHLALEIDPFPRKPGVEFEAPDAGPEPSPFDILKKLKKSE